MKKTYKIILITALTFGFYLVLKGVYFKYILDFFSNLIPNKIISYFLAHLTIGIPLIAGLFFNHKPQYVTNSLGINKGFNKGIILSFLFTLPMLIGYFICFKFNSRISLNGLFLSVIFAALFEELFFRGVLFGQLFRFAKIGFIPSIILGALLFASGHLWQSSDFTVMIGIFAITFFGAIFFAWTYIEWDNNLWVPIGLHLFMNLHWMLFSVADNAFGNVSANIFRAVTITFTIVGTIMYKKRNGLELKINKDNLWIN